jgi:hypothetical protein
MEHQMLAIAFSTGFVSAFMYYYAIFCRFNRRSKELLSSLSKSSEKPAENNGRDVEGATDVIIVGAGVAGSALAYTLGKASNAIFCFSLL